MNNKLKSLISITLEIAFNGTSGFIEELSGIGNSDLCPATFAMTSTVNWDLEFNVIILSVPRMYKQNIQRTRLLINRQFPLVIRDYDRIAW